MFIFICTINGLPKNTNGSHGHWTRSHGERKKWRKASYSAAIDHKPKKPLDKCILTCTRHSSSEPDFDNLAISFKSIIDGLVDAGIMEDDKSSCVVRREYKWEKAKAGKGFVTIKVEEIL